MTRDTTALNPYLVGLEVSHRDGDRVTATMFVTACHYLLVTEKVPNIGSKRLLSLCHRCHITKKEINMKERKHIVKTVQMTQQSITATSMYLSYSTTNYWMNLFRNADGMTLLQEVQVA